MRRLVIALAACVIGSTSTQPSQHPSMRALATAITARRQEQTKLHVVYRPRLLDSLHLNSDQLDSLAALLPTDYVIGEGQAIPMCTKVAPLPCTHVFVQSALVKRDTVTFTISVTQVWGCGSDAAEIDVVRRSDHEVVVASRFAGSGTCGPR